MLRIFSFLFCLVAGAAQAQVTPGTSPLSGAKGGTNNAFMQFGGPASSLKTYTLPNVNATLAALAVVQTWTGAQSYTDGTLILLGASSGSSTLKAPTTGGGTATLFPGSDTIMGVAASQTPTNKTFVCANQTSCVVRIASDVSGLGAGAATFLTTPNSANLAAALTDETGTGAAVFAGSPALTGTPTAPTAAGGTNTTQLATTAGIVQERSATKTLTNTTLDSGGTGNILSVAGVALSKGQYPGEPSTGSATAGNVGEYVESVIVSGSAVALTTATPRNLTSISLTAGDWDISMSANFLPAATTNATVMLASISTTTGTADLTSGRFSQFALSSGVVTAGLNFTVPMPAVRFSLSATTTIFAVVSANFTVSTNSAWGIIHARRVR